jgi:hypothetical protein
MIDPKRAVQIAKEQAVGLLGEQPYNLEELDREDYNGRDVWKVTLSYPDKRRLDNPSFLIRSPRDLFEYKVFAIDADSGEFVNMFLREVGA